MSDGHPADPPALTHQERPTGADELRPAILQDALTGQVLMVAYMNRQALQETRRRGEAVFYSRSRQRLWHKGETSGHRMPVRAIFEDCDRDTLLLLVEPLGPACHTGQRTCFGQETGPLLVELEGVLRRRAAEGGPGSYTRRLLEGGLELRGAKLREEAEEVVRAAAGEGPQRVAEEAADLLYHLTVLLHGQGLALRDALAVLAERRRSG